MAATSAFGMEGVDRAAFEGGDRVLNEAGLVQRVGMDHYLNVETIRDRKAIVDGGGCRAPVFVKLEAHHASDGLLFERLHESAERGAAAAFEVARQIDDGQGIGQRLLAARPHR